jgi:hypothetical protein
MPNGNGNGEEKYTFNPAWCKERHDRIDEEFHKVWDRFKRIDSLMWGILLSLVGNMGGIIAILIQGVQ